MTKKKTKIKHIINWNIVTLILTVSVMIFGIILNWNQRSIDVLETEVTRLSGLNDELQNNSDPEWHIKFSNQKEFYESEIQLIQKAQLILNKDNALEENLANELDNSLTITARQRDIIVEKLLKAEESFELIDNLENQIKIKDELIKIKNELIELQNKKEKSSSKIRSNLNQIIKNQKEQIDLLENTKTSTMLVNLIILFSLLGLLSLFKTIRNNTNTTANNS